MTIAVDFDGTLSLGGVFPSPETPNTPLIAALKEAAANGHRLILWTCRTGEPLAAAVEWCEELGLTFDAINANLPGRMPGTTDSRKVWADVYIDDKAVTWQRFTDTPTMRAERVRRGPPLHRPIQKRWRKLK